MKTLTSKLVLVFVLLFFSFSTLQAQSYTLNSQAEVDAFPTTCNCTSITGDLVIEGANITDLTPMISLSSIGGEFRVTSNPLLTSLNGFQGLIEVQSTLVIYNNSNLTSLDGLNNLVSNGAWFVIANNNNLNSTFGLTNLQFVGETLLIIANNNLESISSLENLQNIYGSLEIILNPQLNSLIGLNNISTVEKNVLINTNNNLSNLQGLNNLSHVGEQLIIADNETMTSLNGLENLNHVEGVLFLFRNNSLKSIESLDNLTSLGNGLSILLNQSLYSLNGLSNVASIDGYLEINDNPILTDCCAIQDLLNNNGVGGMIDVSNNATGCDSQSEVEEVECSGLPSPWETASVGNVEGTSEYDSEDESFTLSADDNSGFMSDNLQFVYQEICDNAEIYAHISDVNNQGFAGIMMRETLDAGSKKVALKTQLSSFVQREIRSTTNGYATSQHIYRPSASWLKLVRNGNSFIGYTSTNGINWQFAMVANVPMSECIHVGITAENFNSTSTATFDNVQVIGDQNNGLVVPENSSIANNSRDQVELTLAPNPASHQTTIEFTNTSKGSLNLKVLNSLGQEVYTKRYSDTAFIREEIQLSEFTAGLYFINIEQEDGERLVKKLIVN